MPDLGPYAGPVLASYGIGIALIVGLVLWARWRAARVARALALVERRRGGG